MIYVRSGVCVYVGNKNKNMVYLSYKCAPFSRVAPGRVSGTNFLFNPNHLPSCWHGKTRLWACLLERYNANLNSNRNQMWNILLTLYQTKYTKADFQICMYSKVMQNYVSPKLHLPSQNVLLAHILETENSFINWCTLQWHNNYTAQETNVGKSIQTDFAWDMYHG